MHAVADLPTPEGNHESSTRDSEMTQIGNLADYWSQLNSWLNALDEKRGRLQEHLLQLRTLYPSWRVGHEQNLDQRPEYFMLLAVILQNIQVSFIHMRDQVCDPEWWRHRAAQLFGPQINDQAYVEALESYQTMTRQYFAAQVVSISEYTLASIATSGHGPFQLHASKGFSNAYEYVLSKASLREKYRDLFDLLRLVRNTFHANGTFSDPRGDTVKKYDGKEYDFQLGQLIKWNNDDMILMAQWIIDAMWEVLNSPSVRGIPYVPVVKPHP